MSLFEDCARHPQRLALVGGLVIFMGAPVLGVCDTCVLVTACGPIMPHPVVEREMAWGIGFVGFGTIAAQICAVALITKGWQCEERWYSG